MRSISNENGDFILKGFEFITQENHEKKQMNDHRYLRHRKQKSLPTKAVRQYKQLYIEDLRFTNLLTWCYFKSVCTCSWFKFILWLFLPLTLTSGIKFIYIYSA